MLDVTIWWLFDIGHVIVTIWWLFGIAHVIYFKI